MLSAIIVAEIPENEQQWLAFLNASGTVPGNEAIEKLAENVWQVDFQKSPASFARIVVAIRQFHLFGKILPLGAESQWLPVDPNSTSI